MPARFYSTKLGRFLSADPHSQPGDPVGVVRYLLADHLGSSTQILDADGTLQESVKYYPYGSAREGGMTGTDKLFTGQREEGGELGLYDYGARFYSTALGRFLSADPLVGVMGGDPQMLDRYAYVRNNPLRYVDPTGLSGTTPFHGPPIDWEKLRQAGETLGRWGVPESEWGRTLRLIASYRGPGPHDPYAPAAYIGEGSSQYDRKVFAWSTDNAAGGMWSGSGYAEPGQCAVQAAVIFDTHDPLNVPGGPRYATGYVLIRGQASNPMTFDVEVESQYGDPIKAEYVGIRYYKGKGQPYQVYRFGYTDEYGCPRAVVVTPVAGGEIPPNEFLGDKTYSWNAEGGEMRIQLYPVSAWYPGPGIRPP